MHLSKLGEFGLIANIQKQCATNLPGIITGIGDDAAVIKFDADQAVATADMMLENVHFDLSYTTFRQLGHKFLAVNISDIYAMAARPRYFLVSLGIPSSLRPSNITELYAGIADLASRHGISVVGGDTCVSKGGLVLSGTLLGEADTVIGRSGAKPGDSIYVTGTLGDSSVGMELLRKRKKKILSFRGAAQQIMKKHLIPEPQYFGPLEGITSMIDISDGLLKDLGHICEQSGTGAIIYRDMIPLSDELLAVCSGNRTPAYEAALSGGEDYVLLFTANRIPDIAAYRIGEIIEKGIFISDSRGNKKPASSRGFEHFK
ncbi:MAG: thiamine-phosphate kinase [Nitrospira sp.]|nr:thiamine-phosphate kinase [bacterium]MBL7050351.1 thiamine-phosphate kinase [Nitrospira sp.]